MAITIVRRMLCVACACAFLVVGCARTVPAPPPTTVGTFDLEEVTIGELQQRMQSGRDTARSLVDKYLARIAAIVERSFVPGTRAELEIKGEFVPLAQTPTAKRLFDIYVGAAAESGLSVGGEFSGGCADSGFAASVGAPTICAVGPVGGNAHSPEEFLRIDTMVPRAQACARAILRLERAGL